MFIDDNCDIEIEKTMKERYKQNLNKIQRECIIFENKKKIFNVKDFDNLYSINKTTEMKISGKVKIFFSHLCFFRSFLLRKNDFEYSITT